MMALVRELRGRLLVDEAAGLRRGVAGILVGDPGMLLLREARACLVDCSGATGDAARAVPEEAETNDSFDELVVAVFGRGEDAGGWNSFLADAAVPLCTENRRGPGGGVSTGGAGFDFMPDPRG
jgi:hypothetical protein